MENKQQKAHISESILSRFSGWLVEKLKNGIFGYFFTSYDATNERFKQRVKKIRKLNSQKRTKRKIARAIENNPIVKVVPKLHHFLLTVSVRDIGLIMLTMAFFSTVLFFIQGYVPVLSWSLSCFITGIVVGVIGMPLVFMQKSVANMLFTGKVFNTIMFGLLGMSDEIYRYTADDDVRSSPSIALLCGIIFSVISYFPGLLWTVVIILVVFLAYHVLITPEVGVVLMILSLPFTSAEIMTALSVYVCICYIIKCIAGRRTFKFEFVDFWMLIMCVTIAIGGVVSFDILSSSIRMAFSVVSLSAFFVLSNLVRSKEWYRRCIISFSIASTTASVIGILQFILGKFGITWSKMSAFATVHEKATSTFSDPDSFALYIVASLAFLLLFILSGKGAKARTVGVICSIVNLVALALSFSKIGLIGVCAMLIFMLLIFNRNSMYFVLGCVVAVLILNYAFPDELLRSITELFTSKTDTHEHRLYAFASAIEMIKARPFGVGLGSVAFENAFSQLVSSSNGEILSSTSNLFLNFAVSCGILGLILLIGTIIVFLRLVLSYCAKTSSRVRRINAIAGFIGAFGIFFAGFYSYCFADQTIITLVAICLALSYAYIKIDSEVYDALETNQSFDYLTASIDIELDKDAVQIYVPTRKYVISPKRKKRKKDTGSALDNIKSNEIDPVIDDDE